jgi:hypothetical protein
MPLTNCTITKESDILVGRKGGDRFPSWIGKLLNNSMVAQDQYAFAWFWKAQVIGYMCRLNNRTRAWIVDAAVRSGIPKHMIRPGCFDISLHVRQSDVREWRVMANDEFASMLYMARRLLGRDPTVFVAADTAASTEFFVRLPGFKMYTLRGFSRDDSVDDVSRERNGDIAAIWAWADFELLGYGSIVIGTFTSNVVRLVMEMRGVQHGMASNLLMEVGEVECVSMAHCEYHGRPWKFDWWLRENVSFGEFVMSDHLGTAKGGSSRGFLGRSLLLLLL